MKRTLLLLALGASTGCTALDLWDAPVVTVEDRVCRSNDDCANLDVTLADSVAGDACVRVTPRCVQSTARCTVDLTVRDDDRDGHRDPRCASNHPELPPFEVDCDDADATAFPGHDADGDGFLVEACALGAPGPYDCDDRHGSVFPGATEACDGFVSACPTSGPVATRRSEDADGDGHSPTTSDCVELRPAGVLVSFAKDDCLDVPTDVDGDGRPEQPALHFPGAPDACDGFQNDCATGTPQPDASEDEDGDGFAPFGVTACDPTVDGGYPATDCDDATATTFPGAAEVCDRIVNDCTARAASGSIERPSEDPDDDGHFAGDAPCIDPITSIECAGAANDPTLRSCVPASERSVFAGVAGQGVAAFTITDIADSGTADVVYAVNADVYVARAADLASRVLVSSAAGNPVASVQVVTAGSALRNDLFIVRERDVGAGLPPRIELVEFGTTAPATPSPAVNFLDTALVPSTVAATFGTLGAGGSAFEAIVFQRNPGTGDELVYARPNTAGATVVDGASGTLAAVRLGDLDGDGDLDVVSAPIGDSAVRYALWNALSGAFEPAVRLALPAGVGNARDVRLGDFEGDGDGDLDVAVMAASGLVVLAQTAPLVFTPLSVGVTVDASGVVTPLPAGAFAVRSIDAGDLDGDGRVELVYARQAEDEVGFVDQIGSGLLAQHVMVSDLDGAASVGIGDLDGDADLDVVAAGTLARTVVTYTSRFVSNLSYSLRTVDRAFNSVQQMRLADVDGDGRVDVLGTASSLNAANLTLWRGLAGTQVSFAESVLPYGTGTPNALATGDFDGDGRIDVAITVAADDDVRVLRGRGDGTFEAAVDVTTVDAPRAVEVGDLDPATGEELVVASNGAAGPSLVLVRSGGGTPTVVTLDAAASGCTDVDVGDYDDDGDLDVVSTCVAHGVRLHEQTPSGYLDSVLLSAAQTDARSTLLTDLDGDGDLDLVVVRVASEQLVLGYNQGGAGVTVRTLDAPFGQPSARAILAAGDVDRDGDVDLVAAGADRVRVLQCVDAGRGRYLPSDVVTGVVAPVAVGVADFDRDGAPDIAAALQGDADLAWWSTGGVPWWNH